MEEKGEPTWLPVAEQMNLLSMCVIVLGTFVAPILKITAIHPEGCFALSLLMLAAYPFALAGDYQLFGKGRNNKVYLPRQEVLVIAITAGVIIIASVWKLRSPIAYLASAALAVLLWLPRRAERPRPVPTVEHSGE